MKPLPYKGAPVTSASKRCCRMSRMVSKPPKDRLATSHVEDMHKWMVKMYPNVEVFCCPFWKKGLMVYLYVFVSAILVFWRLDGRFHFDRNSHKENSVLEAWTSSPSGESNLSCETSKRLYSFSHNSWKCKKRGHGRWVESPTMVVLPLPWFRKTVYSRDFALKNCSHPCHHVEPVFTTISCLHSASPEQRNKALPHSDWWALWLSLNALTLNKIHPFAVTPFHLVGRNTEHWKFKRSQLWPGSILDHNYGLVQLWETMSKSNIERKKMVCIESEPIRCSVLARLP